MTASDAMANPFYASAAAALGCGEKEMRQRPLWSWFPSDTSGFVLAAAWLGLLALGVSSAFLGEAVGWLLAGISLVGLLLVSAGIFQVVAWLVTVVLLTTLAVGGSGLATLGAVLAAAMAALAGWQEVRGSVVAPQPVAADSAPPEVAVPAVPEDPFRDRKGLVVETIGGLRLRVEGTDVTASFLAQRLSAYLWIYLLSRRVSGQATPMKRTALAAEVVVDRPDRERLARLRRILHDLPHRLPAGVAACVRVAGESVDFAVPDDAAIDVEVLRGLVARTRARHVEDAVVALAEVWLRRWSAAEFLPDLEVLEEEVVPHGPAGELVVSLREEVRTLLGDLAVSVSEHRLAQRQPHSAIAVLEPLAEDGRDDVDRLLIQACMEAGQTTRAAALRRRRPASVEV